MTLIVRKKILWMEFDALRLFRQYREAHKNMPHGIRALCHNAI